MKDQQLTDRKTEREKAKRQIEEEKQKRLERLKGQV